MTKQQKISANRKIWKNAFWIFPMMIVILLLILGIMILTQTEIDNL